MNALQTITTITITVLLLFFIIMTLFTTFFSNVVETSQNEFYHQIFPKDEKKIYLIGSSHTGHLNETYIQETYIDLDSNYKIYNLARGEDTPKIRLAYIDDIVHSKPQIVFYGVGYRDFSEEVSKNKITESAPVMPDPSYYFKEIITTTNELLGIESDALHSPQIITRYFIHTLFQNENEKFVSSEIFATSTKPFYAYNESQEFVKSDYALKIEAEENPFSLDSRHQNDQIMALKQMLTKFKENNINVVVFTTPNTKYYIDSLDESDKQNFDSIIQNILDEFTIPVYIFNNKYLDETIWYDFEHVALGGEEITFNQDFGKIIQQEIER